MAEAEHDPDLNRLVNGTIFMLAHAGDNIRIGRYTDQERSDLLNVLDKLTEALRADQARTIITTDRTSQSGRIPQRNGMIEWGRLP